MYYKYDKESLQFKKISLRQYVLGFLVIGFLFSSLGFTGAIKLNNIVEKIPVIIRLNNSFSPEEVREEIVKLNLDHPDVVYAQCLIESGNFSSNIFKNNNNCLGMKLAKSRPTTAVGEDFGHAKYKSWQDCIRDYALWQASYARNLSKQEYLQFLGQIYAEDGSYIVKLKQKIN
jgi:uncharacterized FlgJ-related protein